MVLEGAEVAAVIERKDYSDGLVRNYVQCVEDYGIPMLYRHTIVNIKGKNRVESVTIARTDEHKQPIEGTFSEIECDTILFSRGLIPENELSKEAGVELDRATGGPVVNEAMETTVPGIFACGNVVHVHDLVDWVTDESYRAGKGAAALISGAATRQESNSFFHTKPLKNISYIVPHRVRKELIKDSLELYMRVRGNHENCALVVKADQQVVKRIKKRVLTPGEMVTIKLKKSDLPEQVFENLSVEVAKEAG
jgi:hypothetical protein